MLKVATVKTIQCIIRTSGLWIMDEGPSFNIHSLQSWFKVRSRRCQVTRMTMTSFECLFCGSYFSLFRVSIEVRVEMLKVEFKVKQIKNTAYKMFCFKQTKVLKMERNSNLFIFICCIVMIIKYYFLRIQFVSWHFFLLKKL